MNEIWINQAVLKERLATFFGDRGKDLSLFGRTVNQTFEAFVFATTAAWYREKQWTITFIHPEDGANQPQPLKLKFSTRGRPSNYTYVQCLKDGQTRQIRHQIRVATRSHRSNQKKRANICLDVAVIKPVDTSAFTTNDYIENRDLVSFGEAKHMSAFAELIANFIGLVHELQPGRLKRIRIKNFIPADRGDPSPFLYVSGHLYPTAQGLVETIERRKYDIDVYNRTKSLSQGMHIPTIAAYD